MSSPPESTLRFGNLLGRFRCNRKGDAAVQFALVAPIFFGLLFAIIESALMFFATQVLETVTQDSARLVLTGQVQTQQLTSTQLQQCPLDPKKPDPAAQFLCLVQNKIPGLFDPAKIKVDVQSYPSFSAISLNSQIDANGAFINNMQYNPGASGDVVVVRVFYSWQLFVTGLGFNISNLAGNQRLLVATAAFQNE